MDELPIVVDTVHRMLEVVIDSLDFDRYAPEERKPL